MASTRLLTRSVASAGKRETSPSARRTIMSRLKSRWLSGPFRPSRIAATRIFTVVDSPGWSTPTLRLFVVCCARPRGCRAAEQGDELAPPHVDHGLPPPACPQPITEGTTGPFGHTLNVLNRGVGGGRPDSIVSEAERRWRYQQGPSKHPPSRRADPHSGYLATGWLPARMRSAVAVARPARTRSTIRSTVKPCASISASVPRVGALNPRGLDAHSGGLRMLAGDDRGRRAGSLLGHREIEADAGERLVEAGLVDLTWVGNALDARDQFVAGAEGEIVVQVLVALDIDLGRELAVAGGG